MLLMLLFCFFGCHPTGICFCCCLFSCLPPRQTSSRPKAAHFAAAVERSLYFVFAVAVAVAVALAVTFWLSSGRDLLLSSPLLLLVLSNPHRNRHFDRSSSHLFELRSGETRFSTHTASEPNRRFCLSPLPYLPVKHPTHLSPCKS